MKINCAMDSGKTRVGEAKPKRRETAEDGVSDIKTDRKKKRVGGKFCPPLFELR